MNSMSSSSTTDKSKERNRNEYDYSVTERLLDKYISCPGLASIKRSNKINKKGVA